MKKSHILSLALSAILAFTTPAPAQPVESPTAEDISRLVQEYGLPPVPENSSVLFRRAMVALATCQGLLDIAKDPTLDPETKQARMGEMGEKFMPMLMGSFFSPELMKDAPTKDSTAEEWHRCRDGLLKKGEEDPAAYLALMSIIRNGNDAAPEDMRADDFMHGLVEKAKAGGVPFASEIDAYNHIWGFYGTPVDDAAALAELRKIALANLRNTPEGWLPVLSNVGSICREGDARIPLRITATALAHYLHKAKDAGSKDGSIPYAFGRALTEMDPERPLSGVGRRYFLNTVLEGIAPEDISAAVCVFLEQCFEAVGEVEMAAAVHNRALDLGADFDRDYLIPLSPRYELSIKFGLNNDRNRYLSEAEEEYFLGVIRGMLEELNKALESVPDSQELAYVRRMFSSMISGETNEEESFRFMESVCQEMEKREPGPAVDMLYFILYHPEEGKSLYGKDEEKALTYLHRAAEQGDPTAIFTEVELQLKANPEPTVEQLNRLIGCGTAQSAFRLYELMQEYPEKFEDVEPGTDRYLLSYAMVRGVPSAWRVIAREMEGEDGDEQARIIARALAVANEKGDQEDYVELDDALLAYAAAHPEVKDIVDLLRIVVLDFAMDASPAAKTGLHIRPSYASAAPGELSREVARRLQSLVDSDLSPSDLAEFHRRLEIDIKKAIEDAEQK